MKLYRAHNARKEHLVDPRGGFTLCGLDTAGGAVYSPADNRVDSKVRPLCGVCRTERRVHIAYRMAGGK